MAALLRRLVILKVVFFLFPAFIALSIYRSFIFRSFKSVAYKQLKRPPEPLGRSVEGRANDDNGYATVSESRTSSNYTTGLSPSKTSDDDCTNVLTPELIKEDDQFDDLPTSLQRYIIKHRYARLCIENPESGACSLPILNDFQNSVIIWERPPYRTCCGIGDRMSSITFIFALAVASNRPFFISWGDKYTPYPLELTLSPSYIDWRLPKALKTAKMNAKLRDWTKHRKNGRLSLQNVARNDGTQASLITDDVNDILGSLPVTRLYSRFSLVKHGKIFMMNRSLQNAFPDLANLSHSGLMIGRTMFHALFRPSPIIMHKASTMSPQSSFMAAHIRTGKDAREEIDRFSWAAHATSNQTALTVLYCAMHLSQEKNQQKRDQESLMPSPTNLFIASDSVDVKVAAIHYAHYKNVKVHTTLRKSAHFWSDKAEELSSENSTQKSRNSEKKFSQSVEEQESGKGDACHAYLDIFADAAVLAQADAFITTGSRLSDMAFFMSRKVEMYTMKLKDSSPSHCTMSRVNDRSEY